MVFPVSESVRDHYHTTSNKARTMQMTASLTFDDYGAGNGSGTSGMLSSDPMMSNEARMVQMITPSLLLSDNNVKEHIIVIYRL